MYISSFRVSATRNDIKIFKSNPIKPHNEKQKTYRVDKWCKHIQIFEVFYSIVQHTNQKTKAGFNHTLQIFCLHINT